jgi:hypothetical protein
MYKYTGEGRRERGRRGEGEGGWAWQLSPALLLPSGSGCETHGTKILKEDQAFYTVIGIGIITSCCQLNTAIMATLIKKKIKFSSYIRKIRGIGC